ncbi:MAG: colicin E3/pyocin S6 family cytotoxin [Candidatus Dadabacteria bacterium]
MYVSNETPNIDVFFDNLQVTHIRGPLLEETHYYPFGLIMTGISSKSAGGIENRKKFNGIDQTTELDLNQYDASYRTLDLQLGKFWQIDPLAEMRDSWSPYQFGSDNPILRVDPLGLKDTVVNGEHALANVALETVTVTSHKGTARTQSNFSDFGFAWQGYGSNQRSLNILDPNFNQVYYTPVPKDYRNNGLPGFPGTGRATKHPESKRWRWYDKDGKILEWDSEKGEVEKYDKNGKPGTHHGGYDPETGELNNGSPPKPDRWTYPVSANTMGNTTVVVTTGIILWETLKWGAAIFAAPETGGTSLVLAASTL